MRLRLLFLVMLLTIMATIGYSVDLINEGFEGTFPPTGWTSSGFTQAASPYTGVYSGGSTSTTQYLATPQLANPGTLTYWHRKETGNASFSVQVAPALAGPWTTLTGYPLFAGQGWTQNTTDLSGYSNVFVRWLHVQNENNFFLDDIIIAEADVPPPAINVAGTLSNFGLVKLGDYSTELSYTVSATNLTANLSITAPTGFQVSTTSGSGFGSSLTLTPTGGTVALTTVYVRFAPSTAGPITGNITNASTDATTQNVAAAGTGIDNPVITTPTSGSITSTSVIFGGSITNINYSNVTERGVFYSTINGFADGTGTKVSETGSYQVSIFSLSEIGLVPGTTYYFKAFATNAAGTSYTTQASFSTPSITVTGTLNGFGSVKIGDNSTEQSYSVAGVYLQGNLTVTAPTGYQVSTTSGAGFSSSVVLPPVSGTVSATTIYVRFAPGTSGTISGNITNASINTTTQNVSVTGVGIDNPVVVNPTSSAVTSIAAVLGGQITSINFSNVTERGIYYSTTNGFADGVGTKVSETGTFGTSTFVVNVSGLTQGTTYYFKAFATNAAGTSYTAQASFSTPEITIAGTLGSFGSVKVGSYSTEKTYTVSGIFLTGDMIIMAPAGFQISTSSGAGFGTSISLTPTGGTVNNTTIYVRFAPSATGPYSDNVSNTSTGATSKDLAVSGTGIDNPVVTTPTSGSLTSSTAVLGGNITNVNYSDVTELGIYYSQVSGFADGTGTKVSQTGTFGTGPFNVNVSGLSQGITYYFKAFATNAAGTSYTTQASFVTPAAFSAADITVTQANPAVGKVVIGTIITVTVKDNQNGTPSAFQTVTCDLSQFGGPTNIPMVKVPNIPSNDTYTAIYTVAPGNIEAFNSKASVTVSNYATVEDETEFEVNNYLDVPDILTAYLQVNNDPLDTTFKIGDTIHLKMTLKSYVDSVWVNWGSAFTGAPIIAYKVIGGQIDVTYTPVAGQLITDPNPNLTVVVVRMKSTNGYYTYEVVRPADRMLPFSKSVFNTQPGAPAGSPILADLTIPDISYGQDLFYDMNKPLRFSPVIAGIDGYTTLPNTFAIRFFIPEWGTLGGTSSITLRFVSEDRSTFYRTYSGADVVTLEEDNEYEPMRAVFQQIIWDGKDHLGNYVATGVSTTFGITIWGLEDGVGNNSVLTHALGDEYPPHHDISDGETILNRIHVVVDDLLPVYIQNLTMVNASDAHLIRIINDVNYNSAYDLGESVLYTDSASSTVSNNTTVELSFRVRREYKVDTSILRHEHVNYWVVLEQTGLGTKWVYDGANWIAIAGFDQYDAAALTFASGATNSDTKTLVWDTSNLITFPGSDPGITYKLYAYIQDTAGNLVKSQERNVIVENRYIQLPIITAINLTSQHITGPNYLPAQTGGVNNYYLTAAYTAGDAPYTGNYYVSQDVMSVEFTVNDKGLLRDNQSVLVDFPAGFGIADFYINKADFDAVTNKYTKNINVANISSSAGSLLPGTVWTFSGAAVGATNIQVLAYPPSTVFTGNVPAEDIEPFRLIIPEKPIFPTTNVNDYNLTADPTILSPGNPLFTYDAAINPANDNLIDETEFSFTIPQTTTSLNWTLKLETQDAVPVVFKTWTGTLTGSETPWTSPVYSFLGLKDDLTLGVPATETQLLNLKLIIQPEAYADPGYVAPPESIVPSKVVKVDNTNPTLVNGANSTIDPVTKKITLTTGTPIVTETENQMIFTIYTNEPLPATISTTDGMGWQVVIKDAVGADIVNSVPVTATITNITPSNGNSTDGYKTFIMTVTINNLAGDFDNLNSVLIIKAPWDKASNPGRYNSPIYPYNADVYFNDSSEGYLTFDILNAKPKITNITFTHRGVVGTAAYSGGNWNPQVTQGWVNSGSPNTFTLTATVTGGMYRNLSSNVRADLSAFITGATSVAPDTYVAPANTPNEAKVWTVTWTNKAITAALANAWTNNQVLSIPITINTEDVPNPPVHTDQRNINIKVDKVLPEASSSATSLTANGSAQNLVFTVTDQTPGSGVDWTTASLTLNPNSGITVGTPSVSGNNITYPVTIPANTSHKMIDASFTIMDYMDNVISPTPYHRYINIVPIPAISGVSITTTNPGGISNSYFVPGNTLRVNYSLSNPQRVKRVVITVTASGGVTLLNNVQTISSGFAESMFVLFTGLTSANPADLDGKIITATVTGVTDAYIAPTASATHEINLTGNGSTATINVDTKPVITSTVFKHNGQVINAILKNMTNVTIEATVSHVNALNTTTNPITVTMSGVTGTFTPGTPSSAAITGGTRYTWTNVSFTNLTWSVVNPSDEFYKVADFKFNCRTIYGYQAAERNHQMAVLSDRTNQIYGIVSNPDRTPYAGIDPDGWFAPEHLLKVDYTFISHLNQAMAPIRADFDNIVDSLQTEVWFDPDTTTKTDIIITLQQGGSPVNITVYKYLAQWTVQPDVQSVWNAYEDGGPATVYFKYRQYPINTVPDEINDSRNILVDKKVPVYDDQQLWVAVKSTTPTSGDYQFINNGFNRPTTLALPVATETWVPGNSIFIKYRAKDSVNGVGVIEIYNPANPTGWTIENISQTPLTGGVVEKVIKVTPANPNLITASSTLTVIPGKVEDKVGHVNYGLPVNSTDPNWMLNYNKELVFNFSSDYVTNLRLLEAFQVIGGNYTDNKTKPYVRAGQPLGVKLKLAPMIARGVDVSSIVISNVKINTRYITNVTGGSDNFVTMAYRAADSLYYLNSNYNVNSSYAHGAGISLQYQINYTITYTDNSTSTQTFTSQVIPNQAIVENRSPVLKDVWVWSESLGSSQEGYVVPYDAVGTVRVIFEEQAGYASTTTKPSVSLTNLNVFLGGITSPYTVNPAEISYHTEYSVTINGLVENYNNVWVADINRQVIMPSPVTTSTVIGFTISDVVGNASISGDRFVEIAANGPLVPIIRHKELVTTLPEGQVVKNYFAQLQPSSPDQPTYELKIYTDVALQSYIEDAWATPITGITFGAFSVAETALYNCKYVITIPVTPTDINNISPIDSIMITVNTKRNPFGGQVFYDAETFGVRVDGELFNLANATVTANSVYGPIQGMINPAVETIVTAQVDDIFELIGLRHDDPNLNHVVFPSNIDLASWFTLQNPSPTDTVFIEIPVPVVSGTGNGRTVTWTIPAEDINPRVSTPTGPQNLKIDYRNIYGLTKTYSDIFFNVDTENPQIADFGIRFLNAATVIDSSDYVPMPGWITNSLDWDKVSFTFIDPIIRTDVLGSGVQSATVTMTREPETYALPPMVSPLYHYQTQYNAATNTIDLWFTDGFTANELPEGYYNFNITVVDDIENSVSYTQRFWYGFAPATLLIQPSNNANLFVSDIRQQVSAITGDTQGQIVGVDFHLYFDANNNGTYEADTDLNYTNDIFNDGAFPHSDYVVPFDVMWNMTNRNHYQYQYDNDVYGAAETRKFLLRASIISQNRSVTDTIIVVNVTDDVPPVPQIPWFTGNTVFDYTNEANNVLNFTTNFINWPDAKRVRFEITKDDDPTVIDTIGVELEYPTDYANVQWSYQGAGRGPGQYHVKVYGRDVVGNWSSAVDYPETITINNPASIVTYDMLMWDVEGFGIPELIIPSNTKYGANHPISLIGDLRLGVRFDSLGTPSQVSYNYLEGIAGITFKAKVINNITGTEEIVDVPNNNALQPDYFGTSVGYSTGMIPVTPQIKNVPVRIFVPDYFFMPADYDENDFTYKFYVELTPVDQPFDQPMQAPKYSNLIVDYFAPRVAITSNTPHVTWSKDNQFVLQDSLNHELKNDILDIDDIMLMWSIDGSTWHDAVATQVNDPENKYIRFENWNTKGGSVNTLIYNYEGNVSLKVRAYDEMGNPRESAVIRTYIDNKAPIVPISQVAYSTVINNEIVTGDFVQLHALGTLANETNNTITAVASGDGYGTSILHLRTNQNDISELSTTAIGPQYPEWYDGVPWYTIQNDLRPPIVLFHGYSPDGNEDEIEWTSGRLYDHEADINGNYGYDVDFRAWSDRYHIPIGGTHYFIFAAKDSRGNMEGDFADTLLTFNDDPNHVYLLSYEEMKNAIDLRVNVVNVSDVTCEITQVNQYHTDDIDNKIVSEWINIAADITGNAFNINVDQVQFQRKQGLNWVNIGDPISRANVNEPRPVMFHLYRSDIPQFDGVPYVPGVHLYASNDGNRSFEFVRELTWNQADGAWADTVSFRQGSYSYEYRLDLNNDGIINALDGNIANFLGVNYIITDPNGFDNFEITPWITFVDTRTIPLGLYEFRALPLTAQGDVLFNKVTPSRWLVIDNVAPTTTMTVVGSITRRLPYPDGQYTQFYSPVGNNYYQFKMVADVNGLLVADDDIVDVTYQYASQPQLDVWLNNTSFRRWNDIVNTDNMNGNYPITWAAPSPAHDYIDNDADGLIDENDEKDATYYLRAIAKDKAGNYFTSNIYEIEIDGSAPAMYVNAINGVEMSENNNIFAIPQTGDITVSARIIPIEDFDSPVTTRFQWMYKASQNDTWGSWQFIDGLRPVVDSIATVVIPRPMFGYLEGYYGFKTVSFDALGNVDESPAITYVVFDDVNASNIHITRVGNIDIKSDAFGFAQDIDAYRGFIFAHIDNPFMTNTATFEYAMNENGPWTNINTIPISGQSNIATLWNIPEITRAPFIYLRATAQDFNANNQNSRTVKLYIDNTAPGIIINSFTHTLINNNKVIEPYDSVLINVSYTGLPDDGVVDVSRIGLRLVGPDNSIAIIENYVNVGQANVDFVITEQQLAGLSDGVYELQVRLFDFAGNNTDLINPIIPDGYGALYIDRAAPANLSISSTTHPNWQAPYNSTITYRVGYEDLIGIPAQDAMTAVFTYQHGGNLVTDTVTEYTVNELGSYIEFNWTPSIATESFLDAGNLQVSVNLAVNDYIYFEDMINNDEHIAYLQSDNFFALTYGIPTNIRIMAVSDMVRNSGDTNNNPYDNESYIRETHFVNWNGTLDNPNPHVMEKLGTNHTVAPDDAAPLKLYAYVPHQTEIPDTVVFYYNAPGSSVWNEIGRLTQSTEWNFVDESFAGLYDRQYEMNWNIVNLVGGDYKVKTISKYLAGDSESPEVTISIYNSPLIAMPVVNNMVNGEVQRGNTYVIGVQDYNDHSEYVDMVRYQYRYVNTEGNVITPLSQWMYFGAQEGTEMSDWIAAPHNYPWTVYPYYLYNNDIQIIGFAKDKWGTETPISSIIQNSSYIIAHIADDAAPEIRNITINWNGIQNPKWVSGILSPTATITANIINNSNDIASVEIYYNDILKHTLQYPVNFQGTNFWTEVRNLAIPAIGNQIDEVKVMVYDIYGNYTSMTKQLIIDNAAPEANLLLSSNGITLSELERGIEVLLNANASDPNDGSGIKQVTYTYRKVGDTAWLPIADGDAEAAYTADWIIPENLEFGASYEFRAAVKDSVGHETIVVTEPMEVIDNDTNISIVKVNNHIPANLMVDGQLIPNIPIRLHGTFDVETSVAEGQNIPALEFLIRSKASSFNDWRVITMPEPNVFAVNGVVNHSGLNLNDLQSGIYYLGVAPHERVDANPVDSVMITLDNQLLISGISTTPITEGYFNGSQFVVDFTVDSDDEIDESNVSLQYAYHDYTEDWYNIKKLDNNEYVDVEPMLVSLGIVQDIDNPSIIHHRYRATFNNFVLLHNGSIMNGYYDFRINVSDSASPDSNFVNEVAATNVLYDTTGPEVVISSINDINDMSLPVEIELGTNATVNVIAFDVLGGQVSQVASGIERVEFWYQFGTEPQTFIASVSEAPYSVIWNTLGYQLGNYNLKVVAFDNAGNQSEYIKQVNVITSGSLQPYAVITALDFDNSDSNQDCIYAVTNSWSGQAITGVGFEYFNGTAWLPFAQGTLNQESGVWKALFNAEMMTNIQKVRTVTTYGNGLISTIKPEMIVTWDVLTETFKPVSSMETAIYYRDKLNIMGATRKPIVTTMFESDIFESAIVDRPLVNQILNGEYEAGFEVNDHGNYTFWTSALDNLGNIQLDWIELKTVNGGIASWENNISVPVPAESYLYFENVKNELTLPTGYRRLSNQEAVIVNSTSTGGERNNITITMTLTDVINPQGTVVGMYHDGNAWIGTNIPVVQNSYNSVTFEAPIGYAYAVAQYSDVTINATFVSVAPQYNDAVGNVWTTSNTTLKFRVIDGYSDGGFEVPANGWTNFTMHIDGMQVNAAYANGYITYSTTNDPLTAGAHLVRVVVWKNGFTNIANQTINVDITSPVIIPTPQQISSANRTVSATIYDEFTKIKNVTLRINPVSGDGDCSALTVSLNSSNMQAIGDTYSYELTYDELYSLGYYCNHTHEMEVSWEATNNVDMSSSAGPVYYTVLLEGPSITFTGFENGWWLNPTHNTPLTFNVIPTNGRLIPADGVKVAIVEVTPITGHGDDIQYMTLAPLGDPEAGVYHYELYFGQLLSPEATAVRLEVFARDNYNSFNLSEQTYGFDYAPPVLHAMSPVGNPIDNDGDGLFNEDPIDGINQDQDWDDYNHNGIWDGYDNYCYNNGEYYEPPIIDEDPVDFMPAVLQYGTDVAISLAYQDIPGYYYLPNNQCWYYTGASGIDASSVIITLNGTPIEGITTNGVFTYNAGVLLAGHYTVTASVSDNTGNAGGLSYTFDVVGGAPNVTFLTPDNGWWWLNSNNGNTLKFTVQSDNQLAQDGVVANLYSMPSNTLVQGPMTLNMMEGHYSVVINGGIIPINATGVRLEVIATTVWGNSSTSNQVYGIDNQAPVVTFQTPQNNSEIAINSAVYVTAMISDQIVSAKAAQLKVSSSSATRGTNSDRNSGSGIASVTYFVVDPNGNGIQEPEVYGVNTQTISESFIASIYGIYHINVKAIDFAGNENISSVAVRVLAPAPVITFNMPETGWWLNSNHVSNLKFSVTSVPGVAIPTDGVIAYLYALPSENLVMGPITVSQSGGLYNVILNGGMIPENQTGVRLTVTATNSFGLSSTSNQIYGIDNTPPQITLISPQENAVFLMNQNVHIVATFADANLVSKAQEANVAIRTRNDERNIGSGIASAILRVMAPDGNEAFPSVVDENSPQSISQSFTMTQFGTYHGQIKVYDRVGNESIKLFNMAIQAPAPEISFMPFVSSGWNYSLVNYEPFHFAIHATSNIPVSNVSATFYAMPENVIIQGPQSVAVTESGLYNVTLGTSISQQTTGVRLEVTAMNNLGGVSTHSQVYSVDRDLPVITFLAPVNESQIILVNEQSKINIRAIYNDVMMSKDDNRDSGSGIKLAILVVLNPNNEVVLQKTTGVDTTEVNASVDHLMLGEYTIRLSVWDKAGNKAVASITCKVVSVPLPPASLDITDAHIYPNPITEGTRATFVITLSSSAKVSVKLYDFAGREVRDLYFQHVADTKAPVHIAWDGRNAKGDKLARGPYFARVIANDGKKIVEKVVKVAITK